MSPSTINFYRRTIVPGNLETTLRDFRHRGIFFDVSIATGEGGDNIPAHKLALAASSPVISNMLLSSFSNSSSAAAADHVVALIGVRSEDVMRILDFVYDGYARVPTDEVRSFVELGKKLEITGLLDDDDNVDYSGGTQSTTTTVSIMSAHQDDDAASVLLDRDEKEEGGFHQEFTQVASLPPSSPMVVKYVKEDFFSYDPDHHSNVYHVEEVLEVPERKELIVEIKMEEVPEKVKGPARKRMRKYDKEERGEPSKMMKREEEKKEQEGAQGEEIQNVETMMRDYVVESEDGFECGLCHSRIKARRNMKDHLRAKHLERYDYRCPVCEWLFRSRKLLVSHIRFCHEEEAKSPDLAERIDLCAEKRKKGLFH